LEAISDLLLTFIKKCDIILEIFEKGVRKDAKNYSDVSLLDGVDIGFRVRFGEVSSTFATSSKGLSSNGSNRRVKARDSSFLQNSD
jgi:hypothetical protein